MMCKACGKELIGKEKLFCKSCWSKGADKAKKGAIAVGGLALTVVSVIVTKGKFKGGGDT